MTISRISSDSAYGYFSSASVVASVSSAVQSGNTLIGSFTLPAGVQVSSVKDNSNNRWIQAGYSYASSVGAEIWYARGVAGAASSTYTASVGFTGAGSVGLAISQFTGVYYVDPLDIWSQNSPMGNAPTAASVTQRTSGELTVAVLSTTGSVTALPTGYTSNNASVGLSGGFSSTYAVSPSVSTQSPSWTLNPFTSQNSYLLSSSVSGTAYPVGICAGPSGSNLWVADNNGYAWKTTTAGSATPYYISDPSVEAPIAICAGSVSSARVWVACANNAVYAVSTASGAATRISLDTLATGTYGDICLGPDNNIWVTDTTGYVWKVIGTRGVTQKYPVGNSSGPPQGICAGPDGNLWIAGVGAIFKVTTSGAVTTYGLPSNFTANAICTGPDGNMWWCGFQTNKPDIPNSALVGKMSTSGTQIGSWIVDGQSNLSSICVGPDQNLWIAGNTYSNLIGHPHYPFMITMNTSGQYLAYALGSSQAYGNGICAGPAGASTIWQANDNGYVWATGLQAALPTSATVSACFLPGTSAQNPNLTFPEMLVEVAPDSYSSGFTAPLSGQGIWRNISNYVQAMSFGSLGRQHELDRVQATQGHVTVDARDGTFNAWNTGSFLYKNGHVLPAMTPVKVTAAWNGVTYPVYYGYVQSLELNIKDQLDVDAEIVCVDALQLMSLKYISGNNYESQILALQPNAYYQLGDAVNSNVVIDSSSNGYNGTILGSSTPQIPSFGQLGPFLFDTTTSLETNTTVNGNGGFNTNNSAPNPPKIQDPLSAATNWTAECWFAMNTTVASVGTTSQQNYVASAHGGSNYLPFYSAWYSTSVPSNVVRGQLIEGLGVPQSTFVASVASTTGIYLTQNVNGTAASTQAYVTTFTTLGEASGYGLMSFFANENYFTVDAGLFPNSLTLTQVGAWNITSASASGTTWTYGITSNGIAPIVGQNITVSGCYAPGTTGGAIYNGTWVITSSSTTSFTVTGSTSGPPSATTFGTAIGTVANPILTGTNGAVNLFDKSWHHCVLEYSVAGTTGTASIYIDGQLAGSVPTTSLTTGSLSLTNPTGFTFGQTFMPSIYDFPGNMAQVALYDYNLSSTNIYNNYETGKWFAYAEYGAANGNDDYGRLNKLMDVIGLNSSTMLNCPYPFKTLLYADTNVLTTTSALNYMQTLSESEPGIIFQSPDGMISAYNRQYQYLNPTTVQLQVALTTDGTGIPIEGNTLKLTADDLDVWTNVQVGSGKSGAALQVWGAKQSPTASVNAQTYGDRTLQGLTSLMQDLNTDALALAQNYLYWYENPQIRLSSISIHSYVNQGAAIPFQLGLGLIDLVEVVYAPQTSGDTFSQYYVIESISQTADVSAGPVLTTTYQLSPYEILLTPTILGSFIFGATPGTTGYGQLTL